MPSRLSICNLALARCIAEPIQSVGENSLGARECGRWYPAVISSMLEGPHEWSFAIQRVQLAELTNDREAEWLYAYAKPANMASPIRLLPNFDGLGLSIPVPLTGEPYAETWAGMGGTFEMPYIISGDTIYANAEAATLEYAVSSIEEASIGSLLEQAIALDLAAHLALSVKKDRKLRAEIIPEAEVAMARAIADDMNRQPNWGGVYCSESLIARGQ